MARIEGKRACVAQTPPPLELVSAASETAAPETGAWSARPSSGLAQFRDVNVLDTVRTSVVPVTSVSNVQDGEGVTENHPADPNTARAAAGNEHARLPATGASVEALARKS